MKIPRFTKVEVEWLDAGLESAQLDEEEINHLTPMVRRNVGWLMVNDKEKVSLYFGEICDNQRHKRVFDCTLVIPQGCVTKITPLVNDD